MDSIDFITLMLCDKGYYDYDYEEVKRAEAPTKVEFMSNEEVDRMLSRALIPGTNRLVRGSSKRKVVDMAEALQAEVMREETKRGNI